MKCELCGSDGQVVPYGAGEYTWLHHDCWEQWRAAGYPPIRRSPQSSTGRLDPEVEAHCRLAFASWDEFSEPDREHWRAKFAPSVKHRRHAA